MTKERKVAIGIILALTLIATTTALAVDDLDPTTTWNVTPELRDFPADRICPIDSYLVKDQFQNLSASGSMTYTLPDGSEVTVVITYQAEGLFDFEVIGGTVSRVFVKAQDYLLYEYAPDTNGTNVGPVSFDTGLHTDALDDGERYREISHLDFCLIPKTYEPLTATKTAVGTYDRTVTWTLTKSVDPASHTGYAGEAAGISIWTVVADKTETLGNYQVAGSITIDNPNNYPVDFTISDTLDDGSVATVDCGGDYTVPALGSKTCTYDASATDEAEINTAVITAFEDGIDLGTTASASFVYLENLIGYDSGELTDPRFAGAPWNFTGEMISGDTTETFDETFYCPSDASMYTGGSYSYTAPNTAYLDSNIGLDASAEVTVDCTLPALSVDKTAEGSYDRTVTWTLEKSVDPDSHTGYAGEVAGSSTWTVVADKTEVSDNFQVTGTITINNPAAIPQTFTVGDVLDDGTVSSVLCPTYTVAAGGTVECTYTALPADDSATLNTATVSAPGNAAQTATAAVSFTENLIGYDEGMLSDPRFAGDPWLFTGETISGDTTETFDETFYCPSDASMYTDGLYSFTESNNAYLDSNIGLSAYAEVMVDCTLPALMVDKTAEGSYDRTVNWTLDKSVSPSSHTGFAGETAGSSTWTVVADKSETFGNYQVTGTITIDNPAAIPQTFTVGDELDDGTVSSVDCPTDTVAAGGTVVCTYTASPADDSATLNTATVSAPGNADQTATASVSFTENLIGYDSGLLTDPRFGYSMTIEGDNTQTFPETFTCPADASLYVDGIYTFQEVNTAYLNDNINLQDSATVNVTCTLDALVPTKDAAGSYDRTVTWDLDKSVNPVSFIGGPGSFFDAVWTVDATKSETFGNYQVTGQIWVHNPAAIAQTFTVGDVLDDGTVATVTCDMYTIPAGGTATCTYTADPADGSATLNTATVSAAGNADQTATASVSFTENLIGYDSGTLSDPRFSFSDLISASTTVNFTERFFCPPSGDSSYVDGVYLFEVTNWAYLNGNISLSDSATITVHCEDAQKPSISILNVTLDTADQDEYTASGTFVIQNQSGGDITYVTLGDVYMQFVARGKRGVRGYFSAVCTFSPEADGYVLAPHEAMEFGYTCDLTYASGDLTDLADARELTAFVYVDGAWNQIGEYRDKLWRSSSSPFIFPE